MKQLNQINFKEIRAGISLYRRGPTDPNQLTFQVRANLKSVNNEYEKAEN